MRRAVVKVPEEPAPVAQDAPAAEVPAGGPGGDGVVVHHREGEAAGVAADGKAEQRNLEIE